MRKLDTLLDMLLNGKELSLHYQDHPLKGKWSHYRDIHIEFDWILIYRRTADELRLERTGSHSDLF